MEQIKVAFMRMLVIHYLGGRDIFSDQTELAERLHRKLMLAQSLPCGRVVEVLPRMLGCGGWT